MKRNILIGASIAILLIALVVTIVSNGTYSTNTVSISCGEVSDTTMYVGNTKTITVTIKDADNNDITSDYSDASFEWKIEDTSIASIMENNFKEISVKGNKEGTTTLQISITNGENVIEGSCAINITSKSYKIVPSTELSTNEKGNYVLRYGNETTLNITGIDENYNVAWSIGQGSDIATIDSQTGELIASGIGEVEVIATICENESQDNCDESTITVDVTPNVKNIIVKADGTEVTPNTTFDPTKYGEAYQYKFGSNTEETINKIQINVELNNAKSNVKICKDTEGTDCLEYSANGNTLSVEIDAPKSGESIAINVIDKKEDSTKDGKEKEIIYILQLVNEQSIEPNPDPNPDIDPTKDNLFSVLTSNDTDINEYTIKNGIWEHKVNYPNNVDKVTIYYKLISDNYTCKYSTGEKEQECSTSEGNFSLKIIEGNNPVVITIYKGEEIEQTHAITILRETGEEPSSEKPSEKPSSSEENSGTHVDLTNPTTGNIPKFIISLIMVASLIATLLLYKKNMEKL